MQLLVTLNTVTLNKDQSCVYPLIVIKNQGFLLEVANHKKGRRPEGLLPKARLSARLTEQR